MKKYILNLTFSEQECQEIKSGRLGFGAAGTFGDEGAAGTRGLDLNTFIPEHLERENEFTFPPSSHQSPSRSNRGAATIIRVFTDGSCQNNGKKNSTGGIGIHFPQQEVQDVSLPYHGVLPLSAGTSLEGRGKVTNQRAELTAIYVAIDLILQQFSSSPVEIHLYTDSEYCINSLTNWCYTWKANDWKTSNGKPVKNRDIIEPILALLRKVRVTFFHSAAHTDGQDERSRGNARADWLATQATHRQMTTTTKKAPPKKVRRTE